MAGRGRSRTTAPTTTRSRRQPCAGCGTRNPATHKFCSQCGTPLSAAAATPASRRERRHLTVMFCDLVDSTPLGERLDPEDLHEVTRLYQHACGRVIARYGGHTARYVGDGLLVYFGYPVAHEDDGVRAVHAGLGIVEDVRGLNDEVEPRFGVRLSVRVGIHSGPIVVGEVGDGAPNQEQALGHTMNLAARLQGLAEVDSVVISDATLHLVEGAFVTVARGEQSVKGVRAPVAVHVVQRASGVDRRGVSASGARVSPLIGRDQELAVLLDRWRQARAGRGEVVLVSGEPGIGKSRLLRGLRDAAGPDAVWREGRASPFAQDSALHPLIHLQRQALGLGDDTPPAAQLSALADGVVRAGLDPAEVVPLFAGLHSLPLAPPFQPLPLSPEAQRRRLLERLADWLLAGGAPAAVMFEDLHWFDESTIELLGILIERAAHVPALIVLTFRPEFLPAWSGPHVTPVLLNRLAPAHASQLVRSTAGERPLSDAQVAEIVRRTDGIPLFVEELTKALLDQAAPTPPPVVRDGGGDPLADGSIPATLQDLLAARLDRLGSAKEVAQLCATLGREFSYELLAAVALHDRTTLREELTRLVDAELLEQHGRPPRALYEFRHALIQEAAYHSLLKARRQRYHEHIGRVLEQRFPQVVETRPELVAHHFTCGGLPEPALGYWQRAGMRALGRSANAEAVRYAREALRLLGGLPRSLVRSQQELGLRGVLGMGLAAIKGYGADDVEQTFSRARELCEEIGDTPQLLPILYGLHAFYLVRADRRRTVELAEQLVHLTQNVTDAAPLFMAVGAAGLTHFWQGDHRRAATDLERLVALYDPAQHRPLAVAHNQEPGAAMCMYLALVRWFLGCPDQAVELMDRALAIAGDTPHPLTLAMVTNFAADLRYFRREPAAHRALAERTVALSVEHDFPLWLGGAKSSLGWGLVERGELAAGLSEIHASLALTRATGSLLNRPFILAKLAAAHLRGGTIGEGLDAVGEALALTATNLDRYWEPELHRLQGELLLALSEPNAEAAASSFTRALELARAQDALALELRAARSQAQLWHAQGRRSAARELLGGVYGRFREGFTTPDLLDAKRELDAL